MKRLGVAAALLVLASTAQAQATDCPASTAGVTPAGQAQNAGRDLCLQTKDIFQLFAPQLGVSITGGNATLGQGGTLGGLGHFTIEARGNVVVGDVPDVTNFPVPRTSTPTPEQLPSKHQIVGLPAIDGALGIFKGLPLGLTNVGGIDLLVNAAYVPTVTVGNAAGDHFSVTPATNLKIGYGVRVGALQESLLVPGISVTYVKHDLPTTTMTGTSAQFGSFTMQDAAVKTSSWRIVASKSLILFGLAVGGGQDMYDESATFLGTANTGLVAPLPTTQTFGPFALAQKMTRTNYFADVSMNLLLIKLVGEVGQVRGGTLSPAPFNTFSSGNAGDARTYASVGLRFNW